MTKILLLTMGLLLLSGCGDEKSTGEKMAESVAKIRGANPTPDIAMEKPIKKISSDKPLQEEVIKKEITSQPIIAKEEPKTSLKEMAHKAIAEIKEVTSPTLDTAKDVASIATQSAKEVISETKDATVSKLTAATAAISETVSPRLDKAKEKISTQVSKVKELLQTETNNSK